MSKINIKYVNHEITDSDILYEDNHLIAVNKRAGDIVQVDDTGDESLDDKVKKYIATKYNKPNGAFLGVVHRLDRPVSGVICLQKPARLWSG
jgi:23S rRNA pseudouridine1911/1915/1917 synthase